MKRFVLFTMTVLLMYSAFFAWEITGNTSWEWAKFPTVMLLTVLSIVHLVLGVLDVFKPKEGKS